MEPMKQGLFKSIYSPPSARSTWRLNDLIPSRQIRYFSFARRALAAGLNATAIRKGHCVLLPQFICRDILSSLAAVGARPVFYPVDARLQPAREPKDWPQASAVIAVNYFGFPQNLEPFRRYCALNNAVLIEDNAHGLFSRDDLGQLLGTRTEMGIFSLRKTLPLPDGAALSLSSDRNWNINGKDSFETSNSLRYHLKQSYRALARHFGATHAFRGISLLRNLRRLRTGNRLPEPEVQSEHYLPFPENPCEQLANPILVADPELEEKRRRTLYETVGNSLRKAGFEPLFETLPKGVVPYAFPFRASPEIIGKAFEILSSLGLEPLSWPDLPSTLGETPTHYRNLWLVHFLW